MRHPIGRVVLRFRSLALSGSGEARILYYLVTTPSNTCEPGGVLAIYGPFNYDGTFTSASNARFDAWLKARDPASGVRDFEAVDALAAAQGLVLWQDIAMPANNRTLVWRRGRACASA